MTDTKLLNELIQQKGLKKAFLAEKCGITPVVFSNCLNGKKEFTASQISVLCYWLGITDLKLKEAVFFANFVA